MRKVAFALFVAAFVGMSGSGARAQEAPPPAAAPPQDSTGKLLIAALAGHAIPVNGMEWGIGVGLRAGTRVGAIWIGGTAALYAGDSVDIDWGSTVLADGGRQYYTTLPIFVVGEVGYAFDFHPGPLELQLTPHLDLGAAFISAASHGEYGGDDSTLDGRLAWGWGLTGRAFLDRHWALGVDYRMLPLGDADFDFNEGEVNSHGYSTSVFFHGLSFELAYRL